MSDKKKFVELPSFKLPEWLIDNLKIIDRFSLAGSTSFGPQDYRQMFVSRFKWSEYIDFAKEYGWLFNNTCTTDYYILPKDLDKIITDKISDFFGEDLTDEIVIRLQSMYGARGTAWHIDPTRTVSLIYPVIHQYPAETCFYQQKIPLSNEQSGLVNPAHYQLVDSICIDKCPVLLNVKNVHSVMFGDSKFTKQMPRLSLTVKWKTFDFKTAALAVKE
jgi:hypothetical protein